MNSAPPPDGRRSARPRPRPRTIHVVGAAILEGERCLATQRDRDMENPLEWEFPGGKVKPGEDPRRALVREIREELAVEIAVGELLGATTHRQTDRIIHLAVYSATITGGRIELAEHRSYGWFGSDELDALAWSPADRPLLGPLKRRLTLSDH